MRCKRRGKGCLAGGEKSMYNIVSKRDREREREKYSEREHECLERERER